MPSDEIRMDKKVFEALSSDTRIAILKFLDRRQMTVTELANSLGMAKSTVHGHLCKMVEVGLVEKEDSNRKWTYYRLTPRGRGILHPHERTKIWVLLGSSILTFLGGVSQIIKSVSISVEKEVREKSLSEPSRESPPAPSPAPPPEAEEVLKETWAGYVKEPLILGAVLIAAAFILGCYAYITWRKSREGKIRVEGWQEDN